MTIPAPTPPGPAAENARLRELLARVADHWPPGSAVFPDESYEDAVDRVRK